MEATDRKEVMNRSRASDCLTPSLSPWESVRVRVFVCVAAAIFVSTQAIAQPIIPEKGKTAVTVAGSYISNSACDGTSWQIGASFFGRVDVGVEYLNLGYDEDDFLDMDDKSVIGRVAIHVFSPGAVRPGLALSGFLQLNKNEEGNPGLLDGDRDKTFGLGVWLYKSIALPLVIGIIGRAGVEYSTADRSRESVFGFKDDFSRNSFAWTISATATRMLHPLGDLYLTPAVTFSDDITTYSGDRTTLRVTGGYVLSLPI
jgi:hypothetical protein